MNRLLMSGTLVDKPETRALSGGAKVTSFTVRVERPGRDGAPLAFDDVKAECWGRLAEKVARLPEGVLVLLDGSVKVSSWTTSDGAARSKTYVNATSVVLLPPGETAGMLADPCPRELASAPPWPEPPERPMGLSDAPVAPAVPVDVELPF